MLLFNSNARSGIPGLAIGAEMRMQGTMVRRIRNAARAVIVRDGQLLTVEMRDHRGLYHLLPGGGQRPGETLHIALARECEEEIGVPIEIGTLLFVREYLGRNHNFSSRHRDFHQVEFVFRATLADGAEPCAGCEVDKHQVGIAWIPLENLANARFYPQAVIPYFTRENLECPEVYLGDMN